MKIFEFKMADVRYIKNRLLALTQRPNEPIVRFHWNFAWWSRTAWR